MEDLFLLILFSVLLNPWHVFCSFHRLNDSLHLLLYAHEGYCFMVGNFPQLSVATWKTYISAIVIVRSSFSKCVTMITSRTHGNISNSQESHENTIHRVWHHYALQFWSSHHALQQRPCFLQSRSGDRVGSGFLREIRPSKTKETTKNLPVHYSMR